MTKEKKKFFLIIYEMVFFKLWGKNGQDETLLKFQNCFLPPLNMQLKKASLIKYCFKILTQENKTMLKRKLEGNSSVLKIQT